MGGFYVSILQKEFFKSRLALAVCLLTTCAVAVSSIVLLAGRCRAGGAESVISDYIIRGAGGAGLAGAVAMLVGVGLGLAQYVPEAVDGRIRLTLHLPVPEWQNVLLMCGFGWLSLLAVGLVSFGVYAVGFSQYVPWEIVVDNMRPVLPWCAVSFAGYNLSCAACLDRAVRGRVKWGLCWLAVVLTASFLPGDAGTAWPFMVVVALPTALAPFVSSERYKAGRFR